MFISSASFIPSSFSMNCLLLCQSYQLRRNLAGSIFCGAVAVVLGWPFCAVLLIPIGIDLVYNHGLISCILWGIVSLVITAIPTIAVDSYFYLPLSGALDYAKTYQYGDESKNLPNYVWSSLNLVLYNMFPHGTGSELYGVEQWHFYIRNLILNFNIALIFAFMFLFLLSLLIKVSYNKNVEVKKLSLVVNQRNMCFNAIIWSSPFFLWFLFLTCLPHKEERFMFVVYPQLCFTAACSCVILETSFFSIDGSTKKTDIAPFGTIGPSAFQMPYTALLRNRCLFLVGVIYLTISLARSAALVQYYNAPVQVYGWLGQHIQLNEPDHSGDSKGRKTRVCVGKEWYRFPSHFLLPDSSELMFVESEFQGALPRHFSPLYGSHGPWGGDLFNDVNEIQQGIFVDIASCDYVVDLKLSERADHSLEPWFNTESSHEVDSKQCDEKTDECRMTSGKAVRWKAIHEVKFLDAANTPTLARIFYISALANVYFKQDAKFISYQVLKPEPYLPFD